MTPHFLAGAAIGKSFPRLWIACPAAFASHFLLDRTPHLDTQHLFGAAAGGPTAVVVAAALADTAIGVALVGGLSRRQPDPRIVVLGALFGGLIDLLGNVPLWSGLFRSLPGMASLSAFHHGFQWNVAPSAWPVGIGTQALVVLLALRILSDRTGRG